METKNVVAASIVGVAAVSLIGWQVVNNSTKEESKDDKKVVPAAQDSKSNSNTASLYKDGSYSANGSYETPAGLESVKLSLNISNNQIATATFEATSENDKSIYFQDLFKKGFESEVVGKNIDEVNLSVINGSSLTPNGFMDALNKIKSEAKN